jgi:hypothetical protein
VYTTMKEELQSHHVESGWRRNQEAAKKAAAERGRQMEVAFDLDVQGKKRTPLYKSLNGFVIHNIEDSIL